MNINETVSFELKRETGRGDIYPREELYDWRSIPIKRIASQYTKSLIANDELADLLSFPEEVTDARSSASTALDYANLWQHVTHLLHNLDHLVIYLYYNCGFGYHEDRISKKYPGVESNRTNDIDFVTEDGNILADVTTSKYIEQAHDTKKLKYAQYIGQSNIIDYMTIRVLDYNFLNEDDKVYFNYYRTALLAERNQLYTDCPEPTAMLKIIQDQSRKTVDYSLPQFPDDGVYDDALQRLMGTSFRIDMPLPSSEVDDAVFNYVRDNIGLLDQNFSYKKNENIQKSYEAVLADLSVLDDACRIKEQSILRFTPSEEGTIHLSSGKDYSGSGFKDQERLMELSYLMSKSDVLSLSDDWRTIFRNLSLPADFSGDYKEFSKMCHAKVINENTSMTERESKDSSRIFLITIMAISNSYETLINMPFADKVKSARQLGIGVGEPDRSAVNYYEAQLQDHINSLKSKIDGGSYTLKSRWEDTVRSIINKVDLKVNVKFVKPDSNGPFVKEKINTMKDTVNYSGRTYSAEMVIKSTNMQEVVQGIAKRNLPIETKRIMRSDNDKFYNCVEFSESRAIDFDGFLEYMSEPLRNDHGLLCESISTDPEAKLYEDDVTRYYEDATSTRMYKSLQQHSSLGHRLCYGYKKIIKYNKISVVFDDTLNHMCIMAGGSSEEKSLLILSVVRKLPPAKYYRYLNIQSIIPVPGTEFFFVCHKSFSAERYLIERWVDSITVSLGGCAEDYFRFSNEGIYGDWDNTKRDFLKYYLSFRSILCLESRTRTSKLLEPIRYIMQNAIGLYSNAAKYITDKYKIRPENDMHCFIMTRLHRYLGNDLFELGQRSRQSFNMPSFYCNTIKFRCLQDFLSEMFNVFFCVHNVSGEYHTYLTHYKTIMEFRTKRKNTPSEMTLGWGNMMDRLIDVTHNSKEFYRFVPQVVARSMSLLYDKIYEENGPDRTLQKKFDPETELLDLSSTKSMVNPIPRADGELEKTFIEKFLNKVNNKEHSSQDLFNFRKNLDTMHGLRENRKLIDLYIAESIKNDKTTLGDLMIRTFGKSFVLGLRDKMEEVGKQREFGCPDLTFRVGLKVLELGIENLCSKSSIEMITKGGMKAMLLNKTVDQHLSKADKAKYATIFRLIDHQKWSSGQGPEPYATAAWVLYRKNYLSENEFKWFIYYLDKINSKILLLDMNLVKTNTDNKFVLDLVAECNNDRLAMGEEANAFSMILPGNWIAGMLNRFSSLLNACKCEYADYLLKTKFLLEIITSFFAHSDDGLSVYSWDKKKKSKLDFLDEKYGEDAIFKLCAIVERFVGVCLSLIESDKKVVESALIAEFISIFYHNGDIETPLQKGTGNITTKVPVDLYPYAVTALSGAISDAFQKGASLVTCHALQRLKRLVLFRLFNKNLDQLKVDINWPVAAGGYSEGSILNLLAYGPESDIETKPESNYSYLYHKASTENSSDEGSVVYIPKSNWSIVTRKYERAFDMIKKEIEKFHGDYDEFMFKAEYFMVDNIEFLKSPPSDRLGKLYYYIMMFQRKSMKQAYASKDHMHRIVNVSSLYNNRYTIYKENDVEKLVSYKEYQTIIRQQSKDWYESRDTSVPVLRYYHQVDDVRDWLANKIAHKVVLGDIDKKRKIKTFTKGIQGSDLKNSPESVISAFQKGIRIYQTMPRMRNMETDINYLNAQLKYNNLTFSNWSLIIEAFKRRNASLLRFNLVDRQDLPENMSFFELFYSVQSYSNSRVEIKSSLNINLNIKQVFSYLNQSYRLSTIQMGTIINIYMLLAYENNTANNIKKAFRSILMDVDQNGSKRSVTLETVVNIICETAIKDIATNDMIAQIYVIGCRLYNHKIEHLLRILKNNRKIVRRTTNTSVVRTLITEDYIAVARWPREMEIDTKDFYSNLSLDINIIERSSIDDAIRDSLRILIGMRDNYDRLRRVSTAGHGISYESGQFESVMGGYVFPGIKVTKHRSWRNYSISNDGLSVNFDKAEIFYLRAAKEYDKSISDRSSGVRSSNTYIINLAKKGLLYFTVTGSVDLDKRNSMEIIGDLALSTWERKKLDNKDKKRIIDIGSGADNTFEEINRDVESPIEDFDIDFSDLDAYLDSMGDEDYFTRDNTMPNLNEDEDDMDFSTLGAMGASLSQNYGSRISEVKIRPDGILVTFKSRLDYHSAPFVADQLSRYLSEISGQDISRLTMMRYINADSVGQKYVLLPVILPKMKKELKLSEKANNTIGDYMSRFGIQAMATYYRNNRDYKIRGKTREDVERQMEIISMIMNSFVYVDLGNIESNYRKYRQEDLVTLCSMFGVRLAHKPIAVPVAPVLDFELED